MSFYEALITVGFQGESDFLAHYYSNISKGTVFAPTSQVQSIGARVRVHLELPTTNMMLELEGKVVEATSAGTGKTPGVLIQLGEIHDRNALDLERTVQFLQKHSGRVLFVDDDIPFAEMLRQVLEEIDIGVLHASTPIPALTLLQQGPRFDLIISDIVMPRMDGLEFADATREIAGAKNVPILFVSGADLDETEWAAATRLGDAVMKKPVDIDKFSALVNQLIERHRATRKGERVEPVRGVIVQEQPLDEHTTKMIRLAEIAEKQLRRLGVRTKRSDDSTQVQGELLFQTVTMQHPFGSGEVIPRAEVVAIGHDRVRCYGPPALAALPALPFLDLSGREDLEAALKNAFARHEEQCLEAQQWLQRRELGTRLDPMYFRVLAQSRFGGNKLVFASVMPGEIMLLEVNGRHLGDRMTLDERRAELHGANTKLEAEMLLDSLMKKALARLAAPT